MRDRIQEAIENGQRNQHVLQLLYNWCGHIRARKQGVGMVEQMTGLPIGHMSLECPHAPAGGMSAFELSDTALDFHDRNCVDCKFRKPMGFPNLTELLTERDKRQNAQRLERERQQAETVSRHAARETIRRKIRGALDAISATTLDRIDELDRQEEGAGERLVETAKLAPETFTPAITDHLFDLIESQEHGLSGSSLEAISYLPVDGARLCNAALRAMRSIAHADVGGAIIEKNCANADPTLIADALPSIVSLANPPSFHFGPGHRREPAMGPLNALYAHHKDAVRAGLRQMLESKRPYIARLAALGLDALIPIDGTLTSFLVPELISKLARAARLLEGREDEIEDTLNDVRRVLGLDFKADPTTVDRLIKDFLQGASDEGAAELYKIYKDVLRGERFNDEKTPITHAHDVAFRRLVVAASEARTHDVQRATSDFFHGEPYDMASVAANQLDLLLGSAAVLDGKSAALKDAPLHKKKPEAAIERENQLQYLDDLSDSFIRWACLSAAKADLAAITNVLKFLKGLPEGSDRLVAQLIGYFHAMMRNPDGLIACLPDFYSAQVGASQLVRAFSATAMGKMRGTTHDNLPSLAFEAFCAQLSDPFLIVHKAAFRALERFTLPEAFVERAKRRLIQIIVYYAKERPRDGFLVEAIELYVNRFAEDDPQADEWVDVFVEILKKAEPYTVAKALKYRRTRFINAPAYPALLIQSLNDRQAMSIFDKDLIERLGDLSPNAIVQERQALLTLGKKLMVSHRQVVGVLIEAFSTAGLWDDALALSKAAYDEIEDNIRNKPFRLHSALRMIACDFEAAIQQKDGTRIKTLGNEFRATLTAIEDDHEANKDRRDPLRGLSGAH